MLTGSDAGKTNDLLRGILLKGDVGGCIESRILWETIDTDVPRIVSTVVISISSDGDGTDIGTQSDCPSRAVFVCFTIQVVSDLSPNFCRGVVVKNASGTGVIPVAI